MFSTEWRQNFRLKRMSLRPLTTGVSAGSSLALALKILDWDHKDLLELYRSSSAPSFHPGAFLLGLLCGLLLYFVIEWLVTFRWAVIEWVRSATAAQGQGRRKELYKLL